MQKPCQDSYYTLFSSYPTLLDYHEEQAKNSRWIRCKVADLQVEPLGESSPLIGNLSAFAVGTSQEAVKDTAENLGLAMRVNGELYPVRMTAYKSLLDRAKIGGTALPKLSREVLAEVLNECLKLYSADALLLIRDEKISAVHSGDEVDYSVLPIDELLKALQAKLDARFSGNEFESGYCDHSLVSASWRMEQSTGFPASTVHKALGLIAGEDGEYGDPETLDADLILVDEVSMLDIYLAGDLFDSVKPGSQLILIGDADQLPSVGPGAVLSEMIASGTIPVVKLDKIFRQTAGSRIATNAKLIRHGNMSLEYGSDFQFYDSASIPKSAERIVELYLQETAKYGVDNVALLSPYRQKTETGVNALNELLREKINPPAPDKAEVVHGTRRFRCGDKVMQIKNCDEISNGDIGYITKICKVGDETTVTIDFGDGRMAEYDTSQLDMLDLGYASTIHKSQGSEYRSVIINLQCAHYVMLTRPLVYTAITRGKENVIIVGERRALCMAIKKTDTEKRGTCLAKRLRAAMQ